MSLPRCRSQPIPARWRRCGTSTTPRTLTRPRYPKGRRQDRRRRRRAAGVLQVPMMLGRGRRVLDELAERRSSPRGGSPGEQIHPFEDPERRQRHIVRCGTKPQQQVAVGERPATPTLAVSTGCSGTFVDLKGPAPSATAMQNRGRTSTKAGAPLKAGAIEQASKVLRGLEIATAAAGWRTTSRIGCMEYGGIEYSGLPMKPIFVRYHETHQGISDTPSYR
jgi:hypothetical protein